MPTKLLKNMHQLGLNLEENLFIIDCFNHLLKHKKQKYQQAPRQAGLYIIYNKQTKQTYIGETSSIYRRLGEHLDTLTTHKHHNYKLQNDWVLNQGRGFFVKYYSCVELENSYLRKKVESILIDTWPEQLYNLKR
jgi:hypothetical protein